MKKLLCLALLVSAGSIYSGSISANNKPTDNKSGNNSKDIYTGLNTKCGMNEM